MKRPRISPGLLQAALLAACILPVLTARAAAIADDANPCAETHSMSDAWFTGPMLANTAATAPRGHMLIEPYLYDVTTDGAFTSSGARHSAPHQNSYGSLTYLIYALTNTTGIGLMPTFGYTTAANAASSAGPRSGDLTLLLQHRLTQSRPCCWMPTVSLAVEQTFPTGRYDNLGDRPTNATGAGAFTTTPEFLTQTWFWLPRHRILRMRLNLTDAFSAAVPVTGPSVYGTSTGFRGAAHPGRSLFLDNSWEYSLTRRFILATDITWRANANTRVTGTVTGTDAAQPVLNSGSSTTWNFAPALEYSWKPTLGILLGVRLTPSGRNTSETLTPAIALNIVH
ncbi:MAG TPA: hypothetical protein VHX13_12270 [Acidobacteriaceae bacterium]|jgi:hypothetical protein|nr:hypothetical protein [Acidobacteriaceae bacterium]